MLHIMSSTSGGAGVACDVAANPWGPGASDRRREERPDGLDEVARLPTISAGGFEAAVTCAVGETKEDVTYLAYLSLLGPGTTVVALWATLMDHRAIVVTLEGVGNVQLWNRQPGLTDLGYRITWRRRHRVLQLAHGARVVHLVTEPDLLTGRDPQLADVTPHGRNGRRSRGGNAGSPGQSSAKEDRAGASAASMPPPQGQAQSQPRPQGQHRQRGQAGQGGQEVAAMEQVNEQTARETRPIFILLSQRDENAHTLACRHLLFLAERIQWLAYYEPWADFFWRRGLRTGEVAPLTVWPSFDDEPGGASASATRRMPWITAAYVCRPDPLALAAALPEAIAADTGGDAGAPQAADRAPLAMIEAEGAA